jgi:ketosteroid isomerase-like protein
MTDDELEQLVASLAEQVQRLEDVEQIKNLQRTYVRWLADRQWEAMLDAFTEDAVVDLRHHGVRHGRQEVAELFAAMRSHGEPHDGYVLSSPVIDVDGDTANGVWTWHRHLCEFPVMGATMRVYGPWWEGRYRCTYRREAGRWKISGMHFRVVLPDRDLEPDEMKERAERGEEVIRGAHRTG